MVRYVCNHTRRTFYSCFTYRLLAVPLLRLDQRVRRVLYVQTGDILNTERNAARVLFCESEGQER